MIGNPDTIDPFAMVVYSMAAIGAFGIVLIPWRAFVKLRRWSPAWRRSAYGKALLLMFSAVAGSVMCAELSLLLEIFDCLSGSRCGPTRLGGPMLVGAIGIWYLVLEVVILVLSPAARRLCAARQKVHPASGSTS